MKKEDIINEIDELIDEGEKVLATKWDYSGTSVISFHTYVDSSIYKSWRSKILTFLKMFLSEDSEYVKSIDIIPDNYFSNANTCVCTLNNVKSYIQKGYLLNNKEKKSTDDILNILFGRFHKAARQLRNRYNERDTLSIENERDTLSIEDEYDTQDLLHALLQLYFDDIRAEEWTPSYAGGCARMDFLLKNEKTVIEVKKTRASMKDKDLGDQLIIDVDRYKSHPNCEKLVCFVYDPEGRVGNPKGICNDLNQQHAGCVTVYIQPE